MKTANRVLDTDIKSLSDEELKLLDWFAERLYGVISTEIAIEQKRRKAKKTKKKGP